MNELGLDRHWQKLIFLCWSFGKLKFFTTCPHFDYYKPPRAELRGDATRRWVGKTAATMRVKTAGKFGHHKLQKLSGMD